MANIKINSPCPLYDGMPVTFKAPCDCTAVTGIVVYYGEEGKTFTFRDAHANDLTGIGNLFAAGAYVAVLLDTGNGHAYIQNADTNRYVEERLASIGEGETVAVEISTAVRMVAEFFDDTAMQFNAHNGSMILCAAEANEATFTDRLDATQYLIPIPANATKVTLKTTDPQVTLAQFIGVNGSGGSYTKVFSSAREAVYSYEFEKGAAQWMAIDMIYEDTAAISVPWEYDATETTTVTFTLEETQGVTSWNDLTDKPFGEVSFSSEMSFEPEPADHFDALGNTWWKVSDFAPTKEQFLKTEIAIGALDAAGNPQYSIRWIPGEDDTGEIVLQTEDLTGIQSGDYGIALVSCRKAGELSASLMGTVITVTIPSPGLYFAFAQNTSVPPEYAVGVFYEEVEQLDAKFLPMDAIRDVVNEVISEALEGEY